MSKFVHLHTHSHYSLLTALPTIKELVESAKNDNMDSIALTDNGNLYGAIQFYKECKKNDIKPIVGSDLYIAPRTRFDKESHVDNRWSRLVVLAENDTGYKNLISLVTDGFVEGFYYKPRVDQELLEKYSKGLIAIIPSFSGETSKALQNDDTETAKEKINWYKKSFGENNVFLEITHHPEVSGHEELMKKIINLSKETNTPLVAAHDVYYINPEDRVARETMIKIQTGGVIEDQTGFGESEEDFSFITQKKAEELFKDTPEALLNTIKIADRCNLELELGNWVFPDLKVESGKSYDDEFRDMVYSGIEKRGLQKTDELIERIEYELDIIKTKGYSPYFIVVADLLNFAHKNNILTTIRGSVAGSLATYLAYITTINPLEYKIPFERFLNPERPSAPDIDMDYADNRRDEVIQYARDKYGDDHVAQIGTFGTMMARAVVRDVARALGYPYSVGDTIAKLIPMGSQGFPMTIDKALELTPELEKLYKKDEDVKIIIDLAKKIEGRSRHISVHAAGVVISPTKLTNFVPLQLDPKGTGKLLTQYDMHAVEDAGLLKFDFLGLKNLSILADAIKRVKWHTKEKIDIEKIPLDDKKTFEMLSRGETMGLFQLNGSGMTRYLKELKPSRITDINAMVSLYRPGPMESIPEYIKRKENPDLIKYLDPRMKDILGQSYGVITYQDDVLLIAIKLAGYSWLEADKLRKAMGKKIPAEMEAQREKFQEGCIEKGMSPEKAIKLWKLIEPFAAYGFNKAHAASYGRVAYQTSYMKANYPPEYMAAVLTADSGDTDKVAEAINESVRLGIPVLPPDINESFGDFAVIYDKETSIRFGMHSIKNFGEGIADTIIEERKRSGKFESITDFLERIQDRNLNKRSLEALIKSGAMDSFDDRGVMLQNLDTLLTYNKEASNTSQDSLFGGMSESKMTLDRSVEPPTKSEILGWEKELLGLYISGHPLDKHKELLKKHGMNIKKAVENTHEGVPVAIYGIINDVRPVITKKGDQMAFIKITDLTGTIEAVVFPKPYEQYKDILLQDKCIGIKGRISERNGETSLVTEKIKEI